VGHGSVPAQDAPVAHRGGAQRPGGRAHGRRCRACLWHGEATITRWRDRAAQQAARLHHHFVRDLHLPHVQLDEIRTRLRPRDRVVWLWLALDPKTKLIPALALGARTQQTAHTLVHRLRDTLAGSCTPVITTDGTDTILLLMLDTSIEES